VPPRAAFASGYPVVVIGRRDESISTRVRLGRFTQRRDRSEAMKSRLSKIAFVKNV
jgi:hypothetical protein